MRLAHELDLKGTRKAQRAGGGKANLLSWERLPDFLHAGMQQERSWSFLHTGLQGNPILVTPAPPSH